MPEAPLERGTVLAHFRIVDEIGAGGMGKVYLAEDTRLGRRVALKLMAPGLAADPTRLERFRREARVVAALNHPNIVTIYSVEEEQGVSFLTMELVEGETLSRRLRRGAVPPRELFGLAVPLADAVAAAHERGITHRDLKPDNVMVTRDGRVKVLDFGIARLRGGDDEGRSLEVTNLTATGQLMGTAAYTSPEQAMGREVDSRSDVFSLGIVLFEMATGRHPFLGATSVAVLAAILRDEPRPVTEHDPSLPPFLAEIIARCLEKDPERRYQSARQLRNDLRELERELDEAEILSGKTDGLRGKTESLGRSSAAAAASGAFAPAAAAPSPPAPRPGRLRPLPAALAGLALVAAGAAGWLLLDRGRQAAPEPGATVAPAGAPGRATVAVLHFQNLSRDPDLDWLRTGLTEMLVTDLSQSPQLDVLGTERLHQILLEVGGLGAGPLGFDTVQQVARRAAAEQVVLGSFARLGSDLRISFKVEDPVSGAILASDTVLGQGDEGLLSTVEELIAAVRRELQIVPLPAASAPAPMQQISTSSVEAWRLYSEALQLHVQAKEREAISLLEEAVEIDPGFALALATLGRLHMNLGQGAEGREHTRRAVEHAERLPPRMRLPLKGLDLAGEWVTYGEAIAAFKEALRLYPDDEGIHSNLGELYGFLERHGDAVRHYERLIAKETRFEPTYLSAASSYAALGQLERGYRLLSQQAARDPESWLAQLALGYHLTQWRRLDEAGRRFDRAAAIRPGDVWVLHGRWRLAVLREDWPAAARQAALLGELADPFSRWRGAASRARNLLYRGDSAGALRALAAAETAYPAPEAFTALAHAWAAEVHLDRGDPARAVAEARLAQRLGRNQWPELEGLFLEALAQQRLGRPAAADRIAADLARRAARTPNAVEERQLHRLKGLLALERGDAAAARRALVQAAGLLPPAGVEFHWHARPEHVPVWFALGEVELAAGRPEAARRWFERVARSGAEHVEFPVLYVRSFDRLGRLAAARGDEEGARAGAARFLGLWRDGDLDRERVAAARRRSISGSTGARSRTGT